MEAKIQELAAKTAKEFANISDNQEAAFDPSWILLIAEILTEVIGLFGSCSGNLEEVQKVCTNPTFVQRAILRSKVRRSMGFFSYLRYGRELARAVEDVGKGMTKQDVQELMLD